MNDNSALEHIFQLIQQIEDLAFTSVTGEEHIKAIENFTRQNLEIISETTMLVSDAFKKSHPEIQWSYLAGMKERFIIYPLVFEPGGNSEWAKIVDYLLDLHEVIYYYLKQEDQP